MMQFKRKIIVLCLALLSVFWNDLLYGQVDNKISRVDCPQERIQVHLSQENLFAGEILSFKIYCTSPLFPKEDLSNLAFVELISPDNTSVFRKKILLNHGQGYGDFQIPKDLQTGVYYFLTYTNWLKNFGESSFSRKGILIINPSLPLNSTEVKDSSLLKPSGSKAENAKLKIVSDKKIYKTRSLVSIKIDSNQLNHDEIPEVFSVSVYKKEPQMIFQTDNHLSQNLFNTEKIQSLPDYHGIRLSGKLTDVSGNPIAESPVIASFPGPGTSFKSSITDNNGNFNFLIKPHEGEKEIVFSLPSPNDRISFEEPFVNGFRDFPKDLNYYLSSSAKDYLKEKYFHYQIQSRFDKNYFLPAEKSSVSKDSTVFYSPPYTSTRLKDYYKLDSLREYFYELVPLLKFSKKNDQLEVNVYDPLTYSNLKDKPAIFLDGVYYSDFPAITKIPTSEIDRFVVIPKEYYYKDFSFGGIIDIHTKKSDFNSVPLLPTMTRILYPLANFSEWKFTSPDYSINKDDRIPDYRYLLYWQPNARIEKEGSKVNFYTSDIEGTFVVKITGLTNKGEYIEVEKEIEVEH